jgi:hypothetical protein
LTNLRNCTLMAKPIAMKVASTEESPALISGKGTPITGNIPNAMPHVDEYLKNQTAHDRHNHQHTGARSRERRASLIKRVNSKPYEASSGDIR